MIALQMIIARDSSFARSLDARHHTMLVFCNEDETVAEMTGGTMVPNARLDVGIWSVSEGATQQQSGGIVLAARTSARPILKTRVELHQHEHLANRKGQTVRTRCSLSVIN